MVTAQSTKRRHRRGPRPWRERLHHEAGRFSRCARAYPHTSLAQMGGGGSARKRRTVRRCRHGARTTACGTGTSLTNEVYWSPRWKALLGYGEGEIGTDPEEWLSRIHDEDAQLAKETLEAHLASGIGHYESEHRIRHRDGTYRWMRCRGAAVTDGQGRVTRLAGSLTDITETKVADALTGLPNRLLFVDLLERAIKRTERHPDYVFATAGSRSRSLQGRESEPGRAERRPPAHFGCATASVKPARNRRGLARRRRIHAGTARRRRVHGAARRHHRRERRHSGRRASSSGTLHAVRCRRASGIHVGGRWNHRQHDRL